MSLSVGFGGLVADGRCDAAPTAGVRRVPGRGVGSTGLATVRQGDAVLHVSGACQVMCVSANTSRTLGGDNTLAHSPPPPPRSYLSIHYILRFSVSCPARRTCQRRCRRRAGSTARCRYGRRLRSRSCCLPASPTSWQLIRYGRTLVVVSGYGVTSNRRENVTQTTAMIARDPGWLLIRDTVHPLHGTVDLRCLLQQSLSSFTCCSRRSVTGGVVRLCALRLLLTGLISVLEVRRNSSRHCWRRYPFSEVLFPPHITKTVVGLCS